MLLSLLRKDDIDGCSRIPRFPVCPDLSSVIKGTQLIQAPKLPQQRERKLQDRLSALLRDARPESGTTIHAVSVTSWLTEAESEARTPRDADGLGLTKVNVLEVSCGTCARINP